MTPGEPFPSVQLASETDLDGFKKCCRALIRAGIDPIKVTWQVAGAATSDLFGSTPLVVSESDFQGNRSDAAEALQSLPRILVPPAFLSLCESVILHRDPDRFALLYRILWRLQNESELRHDPLDADLLAAHGMERSVRRDMHKMKAFVRFRPIAAEDDDGLSADDPQHVAWFEPEHHIVGAIAPFFVRRFAQMRWAILTPEQCVSWNGVELEFSLGTGREQAPVADAGEQLWLTYYRSIFNPARLKLRMMQKEMPKRYWKNLPEAALIDQLSSHASERTMAMIDNDPTTPSRPRRSPVAVRAAPKALPNDLAEMRDAVDRCRDCPIGEYATQGVTGEGPQPSQLMFVGEQPGDQEDLRGRPFVGPAGKLFDRALAELGWKRDEVFVTNAVKHFKFELRGKRRLHKTPSQQEAAACLQWLEREIELVKPMALVALGATAARSLMGHPVGVLKERGRWLIRSDGKRVLITLHPSALLRTEPNERETAYKLWLEDLRAASEFAPKSG